jgi:predicted N-acyltransferase
MDVEVFSTLKEISPERWNLLSNENFPFSDYEYLSALEFQNCVGAEAGWIPSYFICREGGKDLAASFLYLKDNSYGEYIFDWEWARAYHQHGIPYYPKGVSAIPFTPATGRKILLRKDLTPEQVKKAQSALIRAGVEYLKTWRVSSGHYLFIDESEVEIFRGESFLVRHSFQYHWQNHGYRDFDDFAQSFKSRKRKQMFKERRGVCEAGVEVDCFTGNSLTPEHADVMYDFYLATIEKMGAIAYLRREFFHDVFRSMADCIVVFLARRQGRWVAGTINYKKGNALYGRYWGCSEEIAGLHFELCYYRTIEYAIAEKLTRLEAGAQGEHKMQRGFLPTLTYSAHWVEHPAFRAAIADVIEREKSSLVLLFKEFENYSPYHAPNKLPA